MTNLIQENSKVILYLGYNNLHVIKVKINEVYQTKFGALKHNDLIGKEFVAGTPLLVHCSLYKE